jgi:hypothetical protein
MATLPFPQPDYETRHQRIRALFARVICEKIALREYWRMSQPKFFKQCRKVSRLSHREKKSLSDSRHMPGGGKQSRANRSPPLIPWNREKYREICRKSAIKLSLACSYAEDSKAWHPNSLRRITGKSQRVSGIGRSGSSVLRFSGGER